MLNCHDLYGVVSMLVLTDKGVNRTDRPNPGWYDVKLALTPPTLPCDHPLQANLIFYDHCDPRNQKSRGGAVVAHPTWCPKSLSSLT
jgi:hypothetical protein